MDKQPLEKHLRGKKFKSLEAEAAKCAKLTDLFGLLMHN